MKRQQITVHRINWLISSRSTTMKTVLTLRLWKSWKGRSNDWDKNWFWILINSEMRPAMMISWTKMKKKHCGCYQMNKGKFLLSSKKQEQTLSTSKENCVRLYKHRSSSLVMRPVLSCRITRFHIISWILTISCQREATVLYTEAGGSIPWSQSKKLRGKSSSKKS